MKSLIKLAISIVILVGGIGLVLSYFSGEESTNIESEKVVVSATIFPLYDITKNIIGDIGEVNLILQPGQSPHTFDPSPSVIKEANASDLFIAIGHSLDPWVEKVANSLGKEVYIPDAGIKLLEFGHADEHEKREDDHHDEHEDEHAEEHDDHEDEHAHEHGDLDPHYWLSPENAKIIAGNIAKKLSAEFPEHEDVFMENLNSYVAQLDKNISNWNKQLAGVQGEVITLHDAFSYFLEYANVELAGTIEPFAGKQPTPKFLAELQETVSEHDIKVVFGEPQLSKDVLLPFARDNGVTVSTLDPLGGVDGSDTYIKLIDQNIQSLVESLK